MSSAELEVLSIRLVYIEVSDSWGGHAHTPCYVMPLTLFIQLPSPEVSALLLPSLFSLYCPSIQGFKNIKLTKTPKGQRAYSKGWGSLPLTSVPVSCVSFQRQSMYRKALTCMYPLWNMPGNCTYFYDSLLTSWFWDTDTAIAVGLPHAV